MTPTPTIPHGCTKERARFNGELVWLITTRSGDQFIVKKTGRHEWCAWSGPEAMAAGDDRVFDHDTHLSYVIQNLDRRTRPLTQGCIVHIPPKEQMMPNDDQKHEIDTLATAYIEGEADDRGLTFRCIGEILAERADLLDYAVDAMTRIFEADSFRQMAA